MVALVPKYMYTLRVPLKGQVFSQVFVTGSYPNNIIRKYSNDSGIDRPLWCIKAQVVGSSSVVLSWVFLTGTYTGGWFLKCCPVLGISDRDLYKHH